MFIYIYINNKTNWTSTANYENKKRESNFIKPCPCAIHIIHSCFKKKSDF